MSDDLARTELAEAIQSGDVVRRFGTGSADAEAARAVETCHAIGRRMHHETQRVVEQLTATGIEVVGHDSDEPRQVHHCSVTVRDTDAARRATEVLTGLGWKRLHDWSGGADRSFWNNSGEVPLLRTADATLVLDVRLDGFSPGGRLDRLFRPRPADWTTLALPRPLWWGYRVVRPVRVAAARLGVAGPSAPAPFLSTPDGLLDPLLDAAAIGPDDVVADLGCGDGRIVVAAAERAGCRAIGVESVAERARSARRRAAESTAAQRIDIVHADATAAPLDDVSVVLMFLPLGMVAGLLPRLLDQLRAGSRVLVHEQSALPERVQPRPTRTFPVIAPEALTVAHLWTVP